MTDKITLTNLTAGYQSVAQLNANLQLIEDALNDAVLYRVNPAGTTNTMSSTLDMNSQRITNLPSPTNNADAARWVDVTDSVELTGSAVPALTGNTGKYISNDGTSLSWERGSEVYVCTDTGSASTYQLTVTGSRQAPDAWRTGHAIVFKPATTNSANGGVSTITVYDQDSAALATKSLKLNGSALSASWLSTSVYYVAVYDGTDVQIIASSKVATEQLNDDAVTLAKLDGDATFAHKLIGYDASGDPTNITNYGRIVTSGSVSAGASIEIDFSSDTGTAGNEYFLRVTGISPATDDVLLYATLYDSDAAAYKATGYKFITSGWDSSNSIPAHRYVTTTTTAAQATILGDANSSRALGTATGEICSLLLHLSNCNQGADAYPLIQGTGTFLTANGDLCKQSITMYNTSPEKYTKIKLTLEGGASFDAAGYYKLFKVA